MKEHVYRAVQYRGSTSIRCCFLDEEGDIQSVDSEPLILKCKNILDLKSMINKVVSAVKEPVLTLPYNTEYIKSKESKDDEA